MKSSTKRKRTR
jgi:hypothetical protein